jgi:hypothetical protein
MARPFVCAVRLTMPEVPEPDHDDPKEVYAFYGLAMYAAQVLEHSILTLAAGLFMTKAPVITRQVFDATFSDLDRKTMGALLKAAQSIMPIPTDIDVVLTDALQKRNYLTHHFFRKHAEIFTHERGRQEMIAELRSLIKAFQRADELVTPLYMAIWKRFGIDEEWIAREIEAIYVEVSRRYGGP